MGRDSLHVRLFRALLRLFPAEFRGDFGGQMTADFDDQRRDVRGKPRELRRLWIRTAVDLLRRAPREHLDVLWRDAVYTVRILLRHPAWAATAVVSLAVGIGLNSAVFSVVSGVLWRDLPFPESDRLVMIGQFTAADTEPEFVPSTVLLDIQRQSRTLDKVGGGTFGTITIIEPEPTELRCYAVSDGFFDALGARPAFGREFNEADYAPSVAHWARPTTPRTAPPEPAVVLLSHAVWQRQFLSDPDVVGRRLRLTDGDSIEVVGVMGPEMETLSASMPTQCWYPMAPDPLQPRAGIYTVIGRLAPNVSIEQASAELEIIGKASVTPSFKGEPRVLRSMALLDRIVGRVETQLTFLFWAVVCVLLVTCANVANLFLAHATGRRDEVVTRTALGATRARLVRQTLTESLLISLVGGGCGLLLAVWGVPLLVAMAPEEVPRLQQIGVDWATFAFTAIVSGAVGALCGLVASMPARRPIGAMPGSVRVTIPGTSRFRQGLTVCEIALALMLVVAATLMVRTVRALGAIELGFNPAQVIYAELPSTIPWNLARSQELHTAVVERVKALPGVRAAGIGIGPLSGGMFTGGLVAAGNPRKFDMVRVDAVSPGYFEALGARLVAGRFFTPSDTSGPVVILVNEAAARAFWGDADPIGRTVVNNNHTEEVIGVVANLREGQLEDEPGLTIYQLSNQSRNFLAGTMLIRVDGDAETLVPSIRTIIRSLAPQAPFSGVTPLQERLDRAMAPRLFVLRVIGLFSVLGLVLAVVGVYGVLAEFVAQRIPEIGVRIAIGATSSDVLALILRHGTRLVAVGVLLGLAGAVLLRGAMTTMVYGVQTLDPLAYLTACLCLLAATVGACTIPARRAARLDPVTALRLGS